MRRKLFSYDPKLKELAKRLRNNSTRSEIKLWTYLNRKQMMGYDFHRQKPIDHFICDFFCHELRLAIELDGLTHQWEPIAQKDLIKTKRLSELGIAMLRFTDEEVMNDIDNVLRSIEHYILDFEEGRKDSPL